MSNPTSIARPYAKALFEHALEKKNLGAWSDWLKTLTVAIDTSEINNLMHNPHITSVQLADILISVIDALKIGTADATLGNFLKLLAQNKRLFVLPEIAVQFETLRAEHEKTLVVKVITYAALTAQQEQSLMDSLSQRLHRQVKLEQTIDKSLLGGAVIRANNLVIDGSIKVQLIKLGAALAA
jgi:F-type H+-transporting ATPase subunit delta